VVKASKHINHYDDSFSTHERLPREYHVEFRPIDNGVKRVEVIMNGIQKVGDAIDDNSFEDDGYRFHDVFHYTFATYLGWSPCARSMMKRKRKSDLKIDRVEDGARAAITEEAISLMIFTEAKNKQFFKKGSVRKSTLKKIKEMTEAFEVRDKSEDEWYIAIKKGYELFRKLRENNGGRIYFNMISKEANYKSL